ncbi:hypothetical protein [Chitinolyticbacter albus]|uniref:hypothetical protein n=1 Tax=Chitinolyticbacter albus TaxID=2961951 RepID=UPI00210D2F6D|nr:hypothetical protein [Chitinolyticbacter albus]
MLANTNMPNLFREQLHFEAFTKELFGSPVVDYARPEPPDFIFERFDKIVGVEHTQIFLDGSSDIKLVAIENIGNDIARRVQLKGADLHYKFQATLLLNLPRAIGPSERENLANEIYRCIVNEINGRNLSGMELFEIRPDNEFIRCIRLFATNETIATRATVARAGWVKRTIDQEVVAAVESKKSKVNEYLTKCSEIWLLVVADGHDPSSWFDAQPPVLKVKFESPFHRVYYLDFFDRRLTEIVVDNG